MRTRILLTLTILIALILPAQGQSYDIQFNIKNFPDSISYLAQYHGDRILSKDTAKVTNGKFAFTGEKKLKAGMYVVAGEANNKIIDILINDDRDFRIRFDAANLVNSISIKGSRENQLFYDYVKEITSKRAQIQRLQKQSKNKNAQQKIRRISKSVDNYQKQFIKENSDTFASAFLKASREIEVPKPPNKNDSTFQYQYYKKHYWDNMPLSDPRMLRTPMFEKRYNKYLNKVVPQQPDSIIVALDRMLNAAPDSSDLFKFMLWNATRKYERSDIMGFDAVFAHLALEYYKKGRTADLNKDVVKNIIEKGENLKNVLIGKKAPNLVMMDTTKKPVSLHAINADYTIVAFWDSECGHCQKQIPKLHQFYQENREKWNLATYAVSTDTSVRKWKDFINKHNLSWTNVLGYWSFTEDFHDLYDINTTPVIYLLDAKKRIIGKRILTKQVKQIIEREEKMKKEKAHIGK